MWFTKEELKLISEGKKTLTIRGFNKKGNMPFKKGSETFLKTGSLFSKERYGRILITDAEIKPLGEMTLDDAVKGGYSSVEEYIQDQVNTFNEGVDTNTEMIFYTFEVISIDRELINKL